MRTTPDSLAARRHWGQRSLPGPAHLQDDGVVLSGMIMLLLVNILIYIYIYFLIAIVIILIMIIIVLMILLKINTNINNSQRGTMPSMLLGMWRKPCAISRTTIQGATYAHDMINTVSILTALRMTTTTTATDDINMSQYGSSSWVGTTPYVT